MPRKPRKDSGVSGLFKDCSHDNWTCPCPWLGRYLQVRRVNLQRWSGTPKKDFNKTRAILALKEMQGQILAGTFNERSREASMHGKSISFGDALDDHESNNPRKGKAYASYYAGWKKQFGKWDLVQLAANGAGDIELWLKQCAKEKNWLPVNTHRWWEYGNRFFNWAKKRKRWVKENPCELVDERLIGNGKARKRNSRITEEQEAALLKVGPSLPDWSWMRRWFIGALDPGLRRSELLHVKRKHVDYKNWKILLPVTKSQEPQYAYVATPRLREVLEQRRFLDANAYVFGDDSGELVSESMFERRWKAWFEAAGLPIGLKVEGGLVWHDLRHEFVSYLLDQGVAIHEVKELARHASIETTMGYATALEGRLKESAAKMARRSS